MSTPFIRTLCCIHGFRQRAERFYYACGYFYVYEVSISNLKFRTKNTENVSNMACQHLVKFFDATC